MKTLLCVLFLLFTTAILWANDMALIQQDIAISRGQTHAFDFHLAPQPGTTVLLEVSSRLDAKAFAGSSYFMKVLVNGKVVQAMLSRTVVRLVNKPVMSPVGPNLPAPWYSRGLWRVVYAPDFEIGRTPAFYDGDPYTVTLDVTDLIDPSAENHVQITNSATSNTASYAGTEADLVIGKFVVHTPRGQSPTLAVAQPAAPIINTGQPGAGPAAYRGQVLPGGGFTLTVGQRQWTFTSNFSYPNAGFNSLGLALPRAHQPGWKVTVQPDGSVLATGPDYAIRRTVNFTSRKAEVADAITNLHRNAPFGLQVHHEVSLAGLRDPEVRLAGNPDVDVNDYYSPANPSVYITGIDHGIGMLCEDDVLRNQARLYCTPASATAGLRTDMLRLGPGETYTLRWSVYPVASRDYFDFVNLVREDWGSNFTVDGPWCFFKPDSIIATPVQTLREQFKRLGIKYVCAWGGWVDGKHDQKRIGFGTGVMDEYWADYRQRIKAAAAKLHEAAPGVKVLGYYDSQRDTSEGEEARFTDSFVTDHNGRQTFTDWSGQYNKTYNVVATTNNSFGSAMLHVADRYLDELGVDGMYWDEVESIDFNYLPLTYRIPDGHSCLLDPKRFTIQREVGITTLLAEAHRLAFIEQVRKKGGVLLGNTPTCTHALLATHVPRMVEIQQNDTLCYEGNLMTPLGYAGERKDFGNVIRGLSQACLLVGTRYDYSYDISRYLFPFTPIELHPGYLLGTERIITIHPGSYGWPDKRCLVQVLHFDREGKLTPVDSPTTIGTEARTAVAPAEGEAVVLDRLPLTLDPHGAEAQVAKVRYSSKTITLSVTAPTGAILHIANGAFPITPGSHYAILVGGEKQTGSIAAPGDTLEVMVNPGTDIPIAVSPSD